MSLLQNENSPWLILLIQGVFLWPTSGFPQNALLGPNLEAFDPIRTALFCFIRCQPKTSWIRLFSNRPGSIEKGLQRIQTTLREIVVRSRSATKIYMLDPLQPGQAKREIELVACDDSGKEAVDGNHPAVAPMMVGEAPSETEKETWAALQPTVGRANQKCVERAVVTILKRLRYFRGDISMRVRLGMLVLQSYKKPPEGEYTLEDFFTMLRNPQSSGQVIRGCVSSYMPHNTLYMLHNTFYLLHNILYLLHNILYPLLNTLYLLPNALYPLLNTLCKLLNTLYTLLNKLYQLLNTSYTILNHLYPLHGRLQ